MDSKAWFRWIFWSLPNRDEIGMTYRIIMYADPPHESRGCHIFHSFAEWMGNELEATEKKNYTIFQSALLLASSSQYNLWELDKEEEPQLLWVEAAASVWDLEPCGALKSSRRAPGSANSDTVCTQVL